MRRRSRHGGERKTPPEDVLALARSLRWEISEDFHQTVMEAIYTDSSRVPLADPGGDGPVRSQQAST